VQNLNKPTRRELLNIAAGGALLALTDSAAGGSEAPTKESESVSHPGIPGEGSGAELNLLTNPECMIGAKYRMGRFIGRGADPAAAEAIFRSLPNLDPIPWVAAWNRLAEPWEQKGADFEKQGLAPDAMKAYQMASLYYSIAKFPVLNHPAKQSAYRKSVTTYLRAAKYFDPPLERITIPFEGKELIGYLRKPKGVTRPPIVIHTGGVDVYNEDWNLADYLDAGLATFRTDMPGAGECPFWYTPDAERIYPPIIDYLAARNDLDAKRMGFIGHSAGGIWGSKIAYIERHRLRATVNWGGPVHYSFEESWLRESAKDKYYFWPILESFVYASHSKDADEWVKKAPAMSLKTQGWLDKPCSPMLVVNGALDGWITIDDTKILYESGDPKAIRVYPDRRHMALEDPASRPLIVRWLSSQLI
jgi:pimeloyl-ACP methyl ester carboxylesterase